MNAVDIIVKKRYGHPLDRDEIEFMVSGFSSGEIPDYQMAAFAMAVCLKGMTYAETAHMTQAMLHSGRVLDLSSVAGIKVDKHSTGGVGDKVSLPLVGIVAAAGVLVPMISGRGLGHTGGTLDKLESIKGFNVNLTAEKFVQNLKDIGAAMIGQTKEIAPADKKLYSLRDVTGTVSSIPLMTSSIMSKKLAEGADAFVIDIKYGRGAFMQKKEDALELAEFLVKTAELSGKRTIGYLTSMSEPLGMKIGNWLEIEETIDMLRGGGPRDLRIITHLFAATMIMLGGKAKTLEDGYKISKKMIDSGKAFDKFVQIVVAQGGDKQMILHPERAPVAKKVVEIKSNGSGYIQAIDSLELGLACVSMGAGRQMVTDSVDPLVGIELMKKVGDPVKRGESIAKIFINDGKGAESLCSRISSAFAIGKKSPPKKRLIECQITKKGVSPAPKVVAQIEASIG